MRNKLALSLWALTGVAGFLTWAWDFPVYVVAAIATCGGFAWLLPQTTENLADLSGKKWLVGLAFTLSLLTALWAILGHSHDAFVKGMVAISVLTGAAWLAAAVTSFKKSEDKPSKVPVG